MLQCMRQLLFPGRGMRIIESFGGPISQAQARLERWMVRWPWPAGGCRRRHALPTATESEAGRRHDAVPARSSRGPAQALDTYEMSYALLSAFDGLLVPLLLRLGCRTLGTANGLRRHRLRTGKFQQEYAGKLNFYIALVDDLLSRNFHNETVGILICGSKNRPQRPVSLGRSTSPMAVAAYTYDKLPPGEQQALSDEGHIVAALEWAEPDAEGTNGSSTGSRR